jgi:hypothetical protein
MSAWRKCTATTDLRPIQIINRQKNEADAMHRPRVFQLAEQAKLEREDDIPNLGSPARLL